MLPENIAKRLDEISKLEAGWDSYGAAKPDPSIIILTTLLLESLLNNVPHIVPSCNGGIGLEFDEHLEIEIMADGLIEIYYDKETKQ